MQKLVLRFTRREVGVVVVCKEMQFFMTFVSLIISKDKHFGVWSQVTQLINELVRHCKDHHYVTFFLIVLLIFCLTYLKLLSHLFCVYVCLF